MLSRTTENRQSSAEKERDMIKHAKGKLPLSEKYWSLE